MCLDQATSLGLSGLRGSSVQANPSSVSHSEMRVAGTACLAALAWWRPSNVSIAVFRRTVGLLAFRIAVPTTSNMALADALALGMLYRSVFVV